MTSSHVHDEARVIPLRPSAPPQAARPAGRPVREPLWRDLVGEVLRRERRAQERTLKDVAEAARISLPYLSEVERGRKEASSEVLAAAAGGLGLSLADLLERARGELIRVTARHIGATPGPGRPGPLHRGTSGARTDGMCLAA